MSKKIAIIGAGVAGLSAGIFARMNGYDVRIFEMHDKPGGLCTAWQRQGYTIDLCLHWLVGSSGEDFYLYKDWRSLGVIDGLDYIMQEQFFRFENDDGRELILYNNIDKLEEHLKGMAGPDLARVEEFIRGLRAFTKVKMRATIDNPLLNNLSMMIGMLPAMGTLRKYGRMTVAEFGAGFKDELLRSAFSNIWEPQMGIMFIMFSLAWAHNGYLGYPIGGSMAFSRAMEKRFYDVGGAIEYKAEVEEVTVKEDRAVGVKLKDGRSYDADYVISAADGHKTIFEMLKGRYMDDKIRGYYNNMPIFTPIVFIGLGVDMDLSGFSAPTGGVAFKIAPIEIAGTKTEWLSFHVHNFDPTLAPANKTLITTSLMSEYDHWKALAGDREAYNKEKQAVADKVIKLLESKIPGISDKVEMVDVSTPLTFERYTNNWKGSYEGWLATPQSLVMRMDKTLRGLQGFYMAGQWVAPGGGLPSGPISAKEVMRAICKADGKKFKTD